MLKSAIAGASHNSDYFSLSIHSGGHNLKNVKKPACVQNL